MNYIKLIIAYYRSADARIMHVPNTMAAISFVLITNI